MSCFLGIETNCDECRMCQDKREEEQASTETDKERKGDLISRERATQEISEIMADALISGFSQNTVFFDELNRKIQECLKNQPVAYDVDKVVEQLEQKGNNIFASHFPEDEQEFMDNGIAKGFWQSAKIVKEGGVDE